jgi:uncharacterized protein DUF2442
LAHNLDQTVRATSVDVSDEMISVDLEDGRTISVPTAWYPRLLHATAAERKRYQIDSVGVTWPDIEADFSIRGLLLGNKSGESQASFKFWLDARRKGKKTSFDDFLKSRRKARKGSRRAA